MGFMTVSPTGGDFKTFVSYNAKAGRWYTKKDGQDEPLFEVTDMTAVFDMPNLKTGWFKFTAGIAPEKAIDPSFTQATPCPGTDFRRGFQIDLYSDKNLLGLREFSSTATIVIEAMNALYDAWAAATEVATGKLPVVRCTGVLPVANKHGTNYQPRLEIVSWVDRPEGLAVTVQDAPAPTPAAPVAAPVTAHVPPPATSTVGQPVF